MRRWLLCLALWSHGIIKSDDYAANAKRGILFMKERFTSTPLESLCSRCSPRKINAARCLIKRTCLLLYCKHRLNHRFSLCSENIWKAHPPLASNGNRGPPSSEISAIRLSSFTQIQLEELTIDYSPMAECLVAFHVPNSSNSGHNIIKAATLRGKEPDTLNG